MKLVKTHLSRGRAGHGPSARSPSTHAIRSESVARNDRCGAVRQAQAGPPAPSQSGQSLSCGRHDCDSHILSYQMPPQMLGRIAESHNRKTLISSKRGDAHFSQSPKRSADLVLNLVELSVLNLVELPRSSMAEAPGALFFFGVIRPILPAEPNIAVKSAYHIILRFCWFASISSFTQQPHRGDRAGSTHTIKEPALPIP